MQTLYTSSQVGISTNLAGGLLVEVVVMLVEMVPLLPIVGMKYLSYS